MKLFPKVALAASGLLAVFSLGMSVFLARDLLAKVPQKDSTQKLRLHFGLYLPESRNAYFAELADGARRGAAKSEAALSVHYVDFHGKTLGIAAGTGVDGIVVCPDLADDSVLENLAQLRAEGLAIVLADHNIAATQPWPFVGTNNFDFGKKAGGVVARECSRSVSIAVVYTDKNPSLYAERELVEMGVSAAFRNLPYSASVMGMKTDSNPRAAEELVYQLVRSRELPSAIVFTDEDDTIAGTQTLIDLNLVGKVQIVGFGRSPEIFSLIRKGVISATLGVRPELIGYDAVTALAELCETGYTSNSVDVDIDVITAAEISSASGSDGGQP